MKMAPADLRAFRAAAIFSASPANLLVSKFESVFLCTPDSAASRSRDHFSAARAARIWSGYKGIETRSIKRLPAEGGMGFIEMFIAMARYCKTIPVDDIAASFFAGSTAIAATRISHDALGENATRRVVGAEIEEKRQEILSNPDTATLEYLRTVILDILMWRRFRTKWSSEFLGKLKRAAADVLGAVQS